MKKSGWLRTKVKPYTGITNPILFPTDIPDPTHLPQPTMARRARLLPTAPRSSGPLTHTKTSPSPTCMFVSVNLHRGAALTFP